jgi:hypothetical protein
VLDQIEAELEKRKLENEGGCLPGVGGAAAHLPALPTTSFFSCQRSQRTSHGSH